jgi:tetratricopeptide (TPR) repeat protein
LYAVETVRMLLADGLVTFEDGVYRPTGDLSELSVPASLHGLIASRLDSLDAADRSLLQAASVIGKTFTLDALAAVSGVQSDELVRQLRALVRREMLTLEADPRSPERGQYGFTQGLIREVAYGTLAKRDRRRMHIAAARYFESLDDDQIAGALAEHYLAAYRAQPDGPEGAAVAAQARLALRGAADRARSLGSFVHAARFLEQALEVTTDPAEQAQLHAAAGRASLNGLLIDEANFHMARSLDLARATGDRGVLMAALVDHATAISATGRVADSVHLLEPARDEYRDLRETAEYVQLVAELARNNLLLGRNADTIAMIDDILPTAERLDLTGEAIELLVTRGPALAGIGRIREGIVTLVGAVAASNSYGLVDAEIRARVNLSFAAAGEDPQLAYRVAREGVDLVQRLGIRGWAYMLSNASALAIRIGDWDWAAREVAEAAQSPNDLAAQMRHAEIQGLRGQDVEQELQRIADIVADMTEIQAIASVDEIRAEVAFARGDDARALDFARRSYRLSLAPDSTTVQTAARAAARSGDLDGVRDAVHALEGQPGRVSVATRREAEAAIAVLEGRRRDGLAGYIDAIRRWRELGLEFEAAVCALNLITLVGPGEIESRAAGLFAGGIFQRVGASPHHAILERAMGAVVAASPPKRDAPVVDETRASAAPAE